MKTFQSFLILSLVLLLPEFAQAVGIAEIPAQQGKAADARTPDQVIGEARLATRNGTWPDAKKSWLQFDLTDLYSENPNLQGNILDAKLTVYGAKSETGAKSYVLSGLNDAAQLEDWDAAALTWNNAPANEVASPTALQASLVTPLYTASVPVPVLDVISETPQASRSVLTAFLNTDTDGKITFIFTPGSTTYLWNAGTALGPTLTLMYALGNNPAKAHNPNPADESIVESSLAFLSWTNPEPNLPGDPIYCDVYLGTEPNRLTMTKVTLENNIETVSLTASFPSLVPLNTNTRYYWAVDCHDPVKGIIEGEMWSFFVGQAPTADAGPDLIRWLESGQLTVSLDGTASDDGPYTILWTQVPNGAPTATINPNNVEDPSVTFTQRGIYEFMITVDDGYLQASDVVQVIVGTDSCDASVLSGSAYNSNDYDHDCDVDLADFADFAADWLVCTNTLEGCL
jgi:hypothetical protein